MAFIVRRYCIFDTLRVLPIGSQTSSESSATPRPQRLTRAACALQKKEQLTHADIT